ncbi:MAG: C13 family peptidase [Rhizomicrobium sp.]
MAEYFARVAAIALVLSCGAAQAAPRPFASWAAVIVAGDHYDADDNPTEGFDNARRDVSRDLLRIGFSPANLVQFSVTPRKYRTEKLLMTRPGAIGRALSRLTQRTSGGCLLYFSSHGAPDGLVVGDWIVPPRALAQTVDYSCGTRPTVVIISACFSGAMLPPLEAPNRMILTAARRDRTSFGCGQTDRYPYFDQCVLQSWGVVADFPALGRKTRGCIAAREKKEHLSPPSDPQLWIGAKASASLPKWR